MRKAQHLLITEAEYKSVAVVSPLDGHLHRTHTESARVLYCVILIIIQLNSVLYFNVLSQQLQQPVTELTRKR